jgi:SEC-C motif domain protein
MSESPCPCGAGPSYEACCGVFHAGAEPPDAVRLMRSRYAAFVRRHTAYLFRTLHPAHEDRARGEAAFMAGMKRHFAERLAYRKLEVLDSQPPDAEGLWRVLFLAHVSRRGKDVSFAELSTFAHDGVGLRYLSGRTFAPAELAGRRIADL